MNATLHLRDGRTMELRQAPWDRSGAVLVSTMLDRDEPQYVVNLYVGGRIGIEKRLRSCPPDQCWAANDIDPDYIEFPDGGRYCWPRKEKTDG